MDIKYCIIIKEYRKTLSLTVNKQLKVVIKMPNRYSLKKAEAFLNSHLEFIEKRKKEIIKENTFFQDFTDKDLKDQAKKIILPLVEKYSRLMGVKPSYVHFTKAKSRYGSCNSKKGLCFSVYLIRYSKRAISSVVVHELAHINNMNHQKAFYDTVLKYMPDYFERQEELKNSF